MAPLINPNPPGDRRNIETLVSPLLCDTDGSHKEIAIKINKHFHSLGKVTIANTPAVDSGSIIHERTNFIFTKKDYQSEESPQT